MATVMATFNDLAFLFKGTFIFSFILLCISKGTPALSLPINKNQIIDVGPQGLSYLSVREINMNTRDQVCKIIGVGYAAALRPDPRIHQVIVDPLGDARTVINVGARRKLRAD